ncbi:MAG: DNA polymerase III subunit beta [Alishewanella sp. 34-51-39]|nr:MAG: DNA polymerase III subunit beta [Alishewanella sp. 34-51-39]
MRLTEQQIMQIKAVVSAELGSQATVTLFGSRQRDDVRGGDIDLLVSCDKDITRPALVAARLEAKIMQLIGIQKIDVLLQAPNLQQSTIHQIAAKGITL